MSALTRNGKTVKVVRRPDLEIRDVRALDFEIQIGGDLVGVEVTRLVTGGRSTAEGLRMRTVIRDRLEPLVVQRDLGAVGVDLALRGLPVRAELRRDTDKFVEILLARLGDMASRPVQRLTVELIGGPRWLDGSRLIQLPSSESRVWFLTSSDDWGGNLGNIASEFAARLIESKRNQGSEYADMRMIVLDTGGLLEADNLTKAFEALRNAVPANWTVIYYESRISPGELTEVYRRAG